MQEHIADVVKFTPPAVITATSLAGFRWDTLSYVLAAIYTAGLIVQQLYRAWKWWKHRDDADYPPHAGA